MGVDKSNIPESYLCELCKPRPIDLRRAIRLQIQKRERELSEFHLSDSHNPLILQNCLHPVPMACAKNDFLKLCVNCSLLT